MNIVITNDDGWKAPGMRVMVKAMRALAESMKPQARIIVLAPDGARSGMSNAVTATCPITLHQLTQEELRADGAEGLEVYTTSGTPSDCVKLAINVLFDGDDRKIDLLMSGVNHGSNAGINLIYSGTIGACLVAAEHSIPAIGFSIYDMSPNPEFKYMAPYVEELTRHLLDTGMRPGTCYNINAPVGPIKGIKWTRQCKTHWVKEMKPSINAEGETVYSLSGYMVNDEPEATDTDEYALTHGFISVQPCHVDMTDYAAL